MDNHRGAGGYIGGYFISEKCDIHSNPDKGKKRGG